jgi:hypothetical protein
MKCIAMLVLAVVSSAASAYPAKDSADVRPKNTPRKPEMPPFRPEEVVVKIGKRKLDARDSLKRGGVSVVANHGTGYCIGQAKCEFILTNYHVTERIGSPLRVNGVKVLETYQATSAQDTNAIWEKSPLGFSVKLVPVRDVAILRMKQPLIGMHGIPFSTRELRAEESVRIYGHPGGGLLNMAEATFYREGKDGLLFFSVKAGQENVLVPGISGSLVINEKNEAVGLVQGIVNGNLAAVVPVWSIADFVKQVQPKTYSEMFSGNGDGAIYRPNNAELVPVDLAMESAALAKDLGSEVGVSPPPALPEQYLWYGLDKAIPPLTPAAVSDDGTHTRTIEPPNIQLLRSNAELMIESINDMIAVGTQRSIGGRTPEMSMQYQLRMVAGHQTFTIDGKEIPQLPCPKGIGAGLGSQWADLPSVVGNNLNLSIQQVDDLPLQGSRSVKVFRYQGTAEDKVALIKFCTDYGLGIHTETVVSVPVRGEVWTDESMNILRITQELLAPPSMGWLNFRASALYGWLELPNGERKLVPTNIISRAELTKDHQIYSTLCRITDYHHFHVHVVVGDRSALLH